MKTYLIVATVVPFALGFLYSSQKTIEISEDAPRISKRSIPISPEKTKRRSKTTESDSSTLAFLHFIKKGYSSASSDEYEKIFDTLNASLLDVSSRFQMNLLLQNWGESAPKQALDKIKRSGGGLELVSLVFSSWAEKAPENAATFYEESQDEQIKNNPYVVISIAGKWALNDPDKAWNWLQSHKEDLFTEDFQDGKKAVIAAISQKYPEKIPQLLTKMEESDWDDNAYSLGFHWGNHTEKAPDWMDTLPEKTRIKAQSGRIMSISKGDLTSIQNQLSSFDSEQQVKIISELGAPLVMEGGLDIKEKVDWLLNSIPEDQYPSFMKNRIECWILEDRKNAKEWIDSLPEGKKKETFLKMHTPPKGRYKS